MYVNFCLIILKRNFRCRMTNYSPLILTKPLWSEGTDLSNRSLHWHDSQTCFLISGSLIQMSGFWSLKDTRRLLFSVLTIDILSVRETDIFTAKPLPVLPCSITSGECQGCSIQFPIIFFFYAGPLKTVTIHHSCTLHNSKLRSFRISVLWNL